MEEYFKLLNDNTAPRAAMRLKVDKVINIACWCLVFLLGLLLGMAM